MSYAAAAPDCQVGSMEMRKGQDIYCEAIRLLPPEVREKASFLFVGKAFPTGRLAHVHALTEQFLL